MPLVHSGCGLKERLLYCYIVQNFGGVKLWANQSVQSFGKKNVDEFTIANISYFSDLEFGWVKYW